MASGPGGGDAAQYTDLVRRRVLNVVGHALKTPVSTLSGLASAAADAPDAELRSEILPALVRNAERVEHLLDELLIAAGITTVLPVEQPEPVQVAVTASDAWSAVSGPGDGLRIEGDAIVSFTPGSFRSVLKHLLRNAHQYAEPPVTLAIAPDGGGRVRLILDAPGAPMREDEVACATEPFFRGDHAVMTASGMGLGLAVAKALVEQAGGTLAVEARREGGLRTLLDLPAA